MKYTARQSTPGTCERDRAVAAVRKQTPAQAQWPLDGTAAGREPTGFFV